MVNVAVVGLGHWGPGLARNIAAVKGARVHTLCDADSTKLAKTATQHPGAHTTADYASILADPEISAVMLATPVHTHFSMAGDALRAGKHVFVEKPLTTKGVECAELVALAEEKRLVLMVGHVFLYNSAVRRVKEYIDSGELGEIYYIYSQRLNLGIVRRDVNALWNFGPHDLSILSYWLDGEPERVSANGFSYLQPGIEDVVFLTMAFPGGVSAHAHISWLDPQKIRRMTVVGSKKMVVYDDASQDAKLVVLDRGFDRKQIESPLGSFDTFGDFQLLLRAGDVLIPHLEFTEPLRVECQHFVECVASAKTPLTDGRHALRVIRALEAAQASMQSLGAEQALA